MDLSSLYSLVSGGVGFLSAFRKKQLYTDQASAYEAQVSINQQIGAFNSQVAEKKTTNIIKAYGLHTRNIMDQQLLSFSNRGISLEGSPMLVLGETMTMGSKQAQEAAFDMQVKKINYIFAAKAAIADASAKREVAQYGAKTANLDIIDKTLQAIGLKQSADNTGQSPTVGLFGIRF